MNAEALLKLVGKLPNFEPWWPAEQRTNWLICFERLLDLIVDRVGAESPQAQLVLRDFGPSLADEGRRCGTCGAFGCACQRGDEHLPDEVEPEPSPPKTTEYSGRSSLPEGEGGIEAPSIVDEVSELVLPTDVKFEEEARERSSRRRECLVCHERKGYRAFEQGECVCSACRSRNTPERTLEGAYYSPNEDGFNLFAKEHSLNFSSAVERRRRMEEWIQGQKAAMGAA